MSLAEKVESFKQSGGFTMVAFDHRGSFRRMMNAADPDSVTDEQMADAKADLIRSMIDLMSGTLVDPVSGLTAYESVATTLPEDIKRVPYLMSMEKSGYDEVSEERFTELQYSGEFLKEHGASGAKLIVYINPTYESFNHQLEIAKQALEDANANGLPLFLEPVTYGEKEGESIGDLLIPSLERFIEAGVTADVWKVEYPGSYEYCQKITQTVGDTPWVLLSRGAVEYDGYKEYMKDVMKSGGDGFLVGRALWKDAMEYTGQERIDFLESTVRDRLVELTDIVLES